MQQIQNIVLVGSGHVATRLGFALKEAGLTIVQVCSRTREHAERLASALHSEAAHQLQNIRSGADLYIIAVSDDAVQEVARGLQAADKFLVHTSGSIPMEVLEPFARNFGVIYPLQTFSRTRPVDFSRIPVCIEASSLRNLELLNLLVSRISRDIRTIPSGQRQVLHLAAVFACNFPNLMYAIAGSLLREVNLDVSLLKPLILETAEKVQTADPEQAQTGPAWRGDQKVMDAHLELLQNNPAARELYRMLSREIVRMKELR